MDVAHKQQAASFLTGIAAHCPALKVFFHTGQGMSHDAVGGYVHFLFPFFA